MSTLVIRAAELAARVHVDQRRKGYGDVPYVNHVIGVAALVAGVTEDQEVLAAALLHDAVEDSDTTLADIEALFGARVAGLVGDVTDDPAISTLPTFQRKSLQAKKMSGASADAKRIKIADQTCNLIDLVATPPGWPPDRMRAYLDGARLVVDACRGVEPSLEDAFDTAAERMAASL